MPCSRGEGDQTRNDLASSGKDLAGVAHEAAKSPEWAQTRPDLRRLGHDIGRATREGAAEAKVKAKQTSEDAKRETHKLATDARRAAHDTQDPNTSG